MAMATAEPIRGTGSPRAWVAPRTRTRPAAVTVAVRAMCGSVTWSLLGLVAWVAVPVLLGAQAAVITSDSMAPHIRAGDVIVSHPYDGGPLRSGSVVTFREPRGGGLVTHRVVDRVGPDTYRTKGDANATPDSSLLEARDVAGVGRYLVPAVGRPKLWVRHADHATLLFSSLVAVLVVAGSCRPSPPSPGRGTRSSTPIARRPRSRRSPRDRTRAPGLDRRSDAPRGPAGDEPGRVWTARSPRRHHRLRRRHRSWASVAVVALTVAAVAPTTVFAAGALAGTTSAAGSWSSDALDVPQDVAVTRDCLVTEKHTTVTWSAASSAGGADGYDVHRSTDSGSYALVAELDGLETTEYSHSGSALDTSSHYVVRTASRSTSWRSSASTEVSSPPCA